MYTTARIKMVREVCCSVYNYSHPLWKWMFFSQQLVSGFIKISVEHICFSSPSRAKV